MTPDLKRVARALCCKHGCENRESKFAICQAHTFEPDARAAVAALMEVSDQVVWSHELPHVGPDEIRAHFQAMLRAVLGDEQEGAGR